MNAMNNVLDQVLTSSRVYSAWLALRAPEVSAHQGNEASLAALPVTLAQFNESWSQFSALTNPVHGIAELDSPLAG